MNSTVTEERGGPQSRVLRRGIRSKALLESQRVAITIFGLLHAAEQASRKLLNRMFSSPFLRELQASTAATVSQVSQLPDGLSTEMAERISDGDGSGGFTVAAFLVHQEQDVLSTLLPAYLELVPLSTEYRVPPGRHPVLVAHGLHSHVRPVWRFAPFRSMAYLETVICIPNVRRRGDPEGHLFQWIPQLHLNHFTPTLLGWAFGLRKQWRSIRTHEFRFAVRGLFSSRERLCVEIDPPEAKAEPALSFEELSPWFDLLEQPIITRGWWGYPRCTHFHWDWARALVCPVRAHMSVQTSEFAGIHVGEYQFEMDTPATTEGFAVRAYLVSVPWRLLLPFEIDELRSLDVRG